MKTQNVYWANISTNLNVDLEPKPLLLDISNSQSEHSGENWVSCPAIKNKHQNTFLTYIPYDINVKIEDNFFYSEDKGISQRPGLYKNSYAFDFNVQRIFFSDVPQIMEVTPAYLHQTSYSKYGHAPSGSFDIGKWFRPSFPTFQMWPNETEFFAKKNEAHLYFNFPSENKIVLKEFYFTDILKHVMEYNVNYKNIKPRQRLESNYDMFTNTKGKELVLSEILNNLL